MPLLIAAAMRANRKDSVSPLLVWEWWNRGHSEW